LSATSIRASAQALQPYVETLPGSVVKVSMVPVPAGSVTIRGQKVAVKPFYIASTETPWEAFDVFIASGPPSVPYDQTPFPPDAVARPSKSYILPDLGWGHHGYPAINLSYLSADMYCRWLAQKTGKKYRLPTEAEWELACRAGKSGPITLTKAQLDKTAWYAGNSDKLTHPVGKKQPNALKLFDMYGNVGEWATDLEGKPILCGGTFRDPAAAQSPTTRKRFVPKWQETDPQLPKSRWWLSDAPFCGFRVVCEP
jgi:formylglycine-generating enzyme required for sulfatase activity